MSGMEAKIRVRDLDVHDWKLVERLFGRSGACGGCWCMHWRMPKGADWEREKGERNRRALKGLVEAGRVHAVLAFAGEEPVGWCCLGPRSDFARLERSRVLKSDAPANAWAVVCFFVPARWRGAGVGSALLAGAIAHARRAGARTLEGYPVAISSESERPYPSAFAFTGVPALFAAAGFRDLTPSGAPRPIYRKSLRPTRG